MFRCQKCKRGWRCECGFVGTTAAILGTVAAATSVASGAIAAKGAKKAGKVQAAGSERAADIYKEHAQQALDFNRQMYQQQREDVRPYQQIGQTGVANLGYLMGLPSQYQAPAPAQPQGQPVRSPAAVPQIPEGVLRPRQEGLMLSQMMGQRRV